MVEEVEGEKEPEAAQENVEIVQEEQEEEVANLNIEPEHHEDAEEGENVGNIPDGFVDPYNHESFSRGLEVNLRNRASSFKQVILNDIKFGKKANIALFKKLTTTE